MRFAMRIAMARLGHIASRKMAGGCWCAAGWAAGSRLLPIFLQQQQPATRAATGTGSSRQNTPLFLSKDREERLRQLLYYSGSFNDIICTAVTPRTKILFRHFLDIFGGSEDPKKSGFSIRHIGQRQRNPFCFHFNL